MIIKIYGDNVLPCLQPLYSFTFSDKYIFCIATNTEFLCNVCIQVFMELLKLNISRIKLHNKESNASSKST